MIPIKDLNPHSTVPYCVYAVIALCTAMTLYQSLLSEAGLAKFLAHFAMVPQIMFTEHRWSVLLTNTFLHADIFHLLGNMLILSIFADNIEHAFGRVRFILFYLFAAAASSLAAALFSADSLIPHLGASGAIMACCGAYFILYPNAEVRLWEWTIRGDLTFEVKAFVLMLWWVLLDLAASFIVDRSHGGISYEAHISGFLIGISLGRLLKIQDCDYDGYILPSGIWVRHRPPPSRRERLLARIDEIADEAAPLRQRRLAEKGSETDPSAWDKYE